MCVGFTVTYYIEHRYVVYMCTTYVWILMSELIMPMIYIGGVMPVIIYVRRELLFFKYET